MAEAKEENIYLTIAKYMKVKYPDLVFRFDYGAGLKLTMGQAIKQKAIQSGRAYPDLFIARKATKVIQGETCEYAGMYIEIKKSDVVLRRPKDAKKLLQGDYKIRKQGDWYDMHIEEQANMLKKLASEGYRADFGVGVNATLKLIDWYLN